MFDSWFPKGYSTLEQLMWLHRMLKAGAAIVWTKVTGTSPLSLPDALAKPIRSLVQYGKCSTSGGEIYCNNGAVKVRHQSGLPVRYHLLSYLRSNAAVDVGVKTTKNTELEAAWTRITSTAQYLYQSDSNSSGSTNTTAYITSGGNWRFGNRTASISPSQDMRYVSIQNSNGVSLNGERVASYGTIGSFTSTNTLRVFGSGASLRIEYLKVRESGVLVRDLVPVRDTVDDTYGFYDLVGGKFYTNGNATFTPGAEVDDPIEVYTVGTPEVLTIGTQTATVQNLFEVGGVADEQDIISGVVTRRVEVTITGGVITISPLATPHTENVTPQPLNTAEGSNTLSWTAEVSGTVKEVEYAQAAPVTVPFIPKNSTGLLTADGKTFRVKEE